MKYLYFIISLLVLGCTKTEYVNKYIEKEVYVPVQVEVPDIRCELRHFDHDKILDSMYKCIIHQKKIIDTIKKKK